MAIPETVFSRDVLGRYVCNTFSEAINSGSFDAIIIGGGTFGLSLAQDLAFRVQGPLTPQNYRVLVLEAGPLVFREHVQDIPNLKIGSPGAVKSDQQTLFDVPPGVRPLNPSNALPSTRQELVGSLLDKQPLFETWGLAWNSAIRFGGLAYCLGGRSLYFGGWSPRHLDTEMETAPADPVKASFPWPAQVVDDLKARFFLEAAKQTGVTTSNDYINGALHDFYRKRLIQIYDTIPNRIPLTELPNYVLEAPEDMSAGLQNRLVSPPYPGFADSLKLDAPLAVQILSRPGFFPFNKFSSPPLGITAARQAAADSNGNDFLKRLMIVPNCHVKSLRTRNYQLATGAMVMEVDGIDTGNGFLDLTAPVQGNSNRRPVVILACGAIESARLAQLTAGMSGAPNAALVGENLMVHLRKNVQFTVPIPAGLTLPDQELSALLVRCRATINGAPAHFHYQIVASANPGGAGAGQSDALLFQNVPDLDDLRRFSETAPGEIDVSIRAVGEMLPNTGNGVTVPRTAPNLDNDEYTVPRALVTLNPRTGGGIETQMMSAMDQGMDFIAQSLFGKTLQSNTIAPDGLGTTFHESGTLRMGEDPLRSVVNADGEFHYATNLYAGDASVLPTCGSSNPVMNGIALRRRLARRLAPEGDGNGTLTATRPFARIFMPASPPAPGTVFTLFDGQSLANWRMAGRGTFHVVDGALQSVPSFDLGLLWCTVPMPENYRLELEFFIPAFQTNSGVFIRFRNPDSTGYHNPAWSAVHTGFEVQIDNTGAGQPMPGMAIHRTGAVYAVSYPGNPSEVPGFPAATAGDFVTPQDATVGGWNQYLVEVVNEVITVKLNGADTARFSIPDPNVVQFPPPYGSNRGRFSTTEPTFVGLQSYSNYGYTTAFRNIRVTVL